jgi:hypothetical protein
MSSKIKIAPSLAIVLGAGSAAMDATKHPVQQHRVAFKHRLSGAVAHGFANFGNAYPMSSMPGAGGGR